MNLHTLRETPPEWLGAALERFERQFVYPLGTDGTFRISHGRNYLPFFAAMGAATVLVAEEAGAVLGTLARVERWIAFHDSCPRKQLVHYLADLKICPQARNGRVLARLILTAKQQIEQSNSRSCYSIVMEGTARLPLEYTGRLGVPVFERLAEIMILRITSSLAGDSSNVSPVIIPPKPDCIVTGGRREERSRMLPVPVVDSAWLEDTRNAKQLWTNEQVEMVSAHLSSFHFDDPSRGAAVIRAAMRALSGGAVPALFLAVPKSRYPGLRAELHDLHITEAPATIYGYRISRDHDWWVDTAEI
ncbi:MAG TPA: hypothetical protein VHM91_06800 [Verrucomicrobiales bacterium]|nr:hypothetical protein [Verrucomicrobiales bacterium]